MKSVELDKIINHISQIKYRSDRRAALRYYVKKYIEKKDAAVVADLTLYFLENEDVLASDLKMAEDAILTFRNPYASLRYSQAVQTDRLAEHEEIVLQANNSVYSRMFATIDGAAVNKHSKVVLNAKSARESYMFLVDHPKVDKREHLSVIVEENDPYFIFEIARELNGVGCKKLENAILKLESPLYSYLYAKEVPGANIVGHQTVVWFRGTYDETYQFVQDIEKADMQFYYREFYKQIKRKPTPELADLCRKVIAIEKERAKHEIQKSQQEDENI